MASITITIPVDQEQRVRDAFTELLNLKQPATIAEVKEYIIKDIKQVVRNAERQAAARAAQEADGPAPDIT